MGNEGKVWENCKGYAIIRVISVRVMRNLVRVMRSLLYQHTAIFQQYRIVYNGTEQSGQIIRFQGINSLQYFYETFHPIFLTKS